MSKKIIRVKYGILGYGYASLIAYHKLLKEHQHEDILILQNEKATPIFTLKYKGFEFSPLPIFPVEESELYNTDLFSDLPNQNPISVSFSDLKNFDYTGFEVKSDSLANFMVKAQGIDKNLCLGAKQWGTEMFTLPLSQVQSKIKRHYVEPKGNTRIGYVNGQSLFKYAIDKLKPNRLDHSGIQKIDIEEKEIHLTDHIIRYDHLISTIPLHYLFQLCNLSFHHNTASAGCHFYFFKHKGGFKENQMVYDCDFHSEIIRIFSISDNFLMVQLNGNKHKAIEISKLTDRIGHLASDIIDLEYATELYMPMCYPLELISDQRTLKSISRLSSENIIPFGRFGNWEYSDLHELDWSILPL